MVLATTAQDKGCDAIAAAWAASRNVKLVAFGLDRRLGTRAGFARNETMVRLRPIEAVVCEGSGLQSHLARRVRSGGIPAHFFTLNGQTRRAAS
ncbi:SLOG family protein [Sphingomonas sp. AP4-R1]|uniref:SLOG family protein n=1 Tax=Sphingomonas sp. AP4-R1 TaxID=2735134 RepID=UPI0034620774